MKWFCLLLLSAIVARASVCTDGSKTCTTDGSNADLTSAITYIRGRNESGWLVKMGAAHGSYTWTGAVDAHLSDLGNYSLEIESFDITDPITISNTYKAGVVLTLNGGTGLQSVHDIRFVDYFPINDMTIGAPCFMLIQGRSECVHLYNLYLRGTGDINSFFCWIGGNFVNGGGDGPFGLVDHVTLDQSNSARLSGFFVHQNLDSSDAEWDNTHTVTWGDLNNVFFEDNTVLDTTFGHGAGLIDGNQAAKLVVRYNDITGTGLGYHGRDSGSDGSHFKQGTLQADFYQNIFRVPTGASISFLLQARSGAALGHDNAIVITGGSVTSFFTGREECATDQFSSIGCRTTSGTVLAQAFTANPFPSDYTSEHATGQMVGTPQVAHIWNTSVTGGSVTIAGGFPGDFVALGRDILTTSFSHSDATYPHHLNTGHSNAAPVVLAAPQVSGIAAVAQTLTSTQGLFSGFPVPTKTYQWKLCDSAGNNCSDVSGETALTYLVRSTDAESQAKQCTTATNSQGSATSCSNLTGTISGSSPFNLIINGGFEQYLGTIDFYQQNNGSFTGWTITNLYGDVVPSANSHSGSIGFRCTTNFAGNVKLQQTVATVSGQSYPLKFWNMNTSGAPTYTVKDAASNTILGPTSANHASYVQTVTSFTAATGTTSTLIIDFSAVQPGESAYVDEVEIIPPEEPAGGSGGAGVSLSSFKQSKAAVKKK